LTKETVISQQEQIRYKDLLLQVQRFLKFGTKGTAREVVDRQAKEFDLRLSAFVQSYETRKVSRLRQKLKPLYAGVEC
jgi:hypothetical protein